MEQEFTRFLAATPEEFAAQRDEAARMADPLAAAAAIGPRPLLVVHGTADRWVPVAQARELSARAGPSCRYVEVDGADHAFSRHRAQLRDLIAGWLAGSATTTGRAAGVTTQVKGGAMSAVLSARCHRSRYAGWGSSGRG